MSSAKDELKSQLQRKSLAEIEAKIADQKRKMGAEKNLLTLQRLSSELSVMQEVREQKLKENSRLLQKNTKSAAKPELKSFDDYIKSKT